MARRRGDVRRVRRRHARALRALSQHAQVVRARRAPRRRGGAHRRHRREGRGPPRARRRAARAARRHPRGHRQLRGRARPRSAQRGLARGPARAAQARRASRRRRSRAPRSRTTPPTTGGSCSISPSIASTPRRRPRRRSRSSWRRRRSPRRARRIPTPRSRSCGARCCSTRADEANDSTLEELFRLAELTRSFRSLADALREAIEPPEAAKSAGRARSASAWARCSRRASTSCARRSTLTCRLHTTTRPTSMRHAPSSASPAARCAGTPPHASSSRRRALARRSSPRSSGRRGGGGRGERLGRDHVRARVARARRRRPLRRTSHATSRPRSPCGIAIVAAIPDAAEAAFARALAHDTANAGMLAELTKLQRRAKGRPLVDSLLRLSQATGGDLDLLTEAADAAISSVGDRALSKSILDRLLAARHRALDLSARPSRLRRVGDGERSGATGRHLRNAGARPRRYVDRATTELVKIYEGDGDHDKVVALLVETSALPWPREKSRALRHEAARIAVEKQNAADRATGIYLALIDEDPQDNDCRRAPREDLRGRRSQDRAARAEAAPRRHGAEPGAQARPPTRGRASRGRPRRRLEGHRRARGEPRGVTASRSDGARALGALRARRQARRARDALREPGRARREGRREHARRRSPCARRRGRGDEARRRPERDPASATRRRPRAARRRRSMRSPASRPPHAITRAPQATSIACARWPMARRARRSRFVSPMRSSLPARSPTRRSGSSPRWRAIPSRITCACASPRCIAPRRRGARSPSCSPTAPRTRPTRRRASVASARPRSCIAASTGEPERAIPLLEQASDLSPDDNAVKLALADALGAAGRFEEARTNLRTLVEAFGGRRPKERAPVHYHLARLDLAVGDRARALVELDAATRIDPANPEILRTLAELARDDGQLDRAERSYRALLTVLRRQEEIAEDAPISRSEVMFELSKIAGRQGEPDRAKEILESAFEVSTESVVEARRLEARPARRRRPRQPRARSRGAHHAQRYARRRREHLRRAGSPLRRRTSVASRTPSRCVSARSTSIPAPTRSHEAAQRLATTLGKVGELRAARSCARRSRAGR